MPTTERAMADGALMIDQSGHEALPNVSARRRYLAVLFSDLSGSTRLAGAMEAEDFAALLASLRRTYEDVIPRHGGMVVHIRGDGVLASFGYPDAREDDGRRATEAALDLHDWVRHLRLGFSFQLTINLKTANALGLTPSSGLISITDEVIE